MEPEITDHFQFKNFRIDQNHRVFRVNTEAVLLVSWVGIQSGKRILEIGSGTGLISIALVSKNRQNEVWAIDHDPEAVQLTLHNIHINQFRIQCIYQGLKEFALSHNEKFDLIVSNPPFHSPDYKSDKKRNIFSKYTDSLPYQDLIHYSQRLLADRGEIYLVVSKTGLNEILHIMDREGLYLQKELMIESREGKPVKRVLIKISRDRPEEPGIGQLTILNKKGEYTDSYIAMTREYYTVFP